jgi:phage gp36-like protein
MNYVTIADMIARFGYDAINELSDQSNSGQVDEDNVTLAIEHAESEIDSYLSSRYTTPITPAPVILRKVALNLAFYNLHDDHPTEGVEKLYKDGVDWLKAISAGKASIGVEDESTGFGIATSHEESDRIFTVSTLEGY